MAEEDEATSGNDDGDDVKDSNVVNNEKKDASSLSQQIHTQLARFVDNDDASSAIESKLKVANDLTPHLCQGVDAYIDMGGDCRDCCNSSGNEHTSNHNTLPTLDWNRHFRKSYSILFWVRPSVCTNEKKQGEQGDGATDSSTTTTKKQPQQRRILYRFATFPDDASAQGVCVTLGEWTAIQNTPQDSNNAQENSTPTHHENNNKLWLQTSVTAFSLPHYSTTSIMSAAANEQQGMMTMSPQALLSSASNTSASNQHHHSSFITCSLMLPANQWSLIGISHIFPYLKRPQWTMCVDGRVVASGELGYPTMLSETTASMSQNVILQNVFDGGATSVIYNKNKNDDDTKTPASRLAVQRQSQHFSSNQKMYNLHMHLASLAIHPDAISPNLQALLAEAGPLLSQQQQGRIVVTLPPVSNWSKGSSLEGPNVGIPLCTSSQSLELQRLASRVILSYSATMTLVEMLGGGDSSTNTGDRRRCKITCQAHQFTGDTDNTPKVGLVQPESMVQPPLESPLILSGPNMTVVRTLTKYLNTCSAVVLDNASQEEQSQLSFSVLVYEQSALVTFVLPFFLALVPTGYVMAELQHELYRSSLKQLYSLYINDGELASKLVSLLGYAIHYGGGRVQEEVLQSGLLHILASTLRRSLVRAYNVGLLETTDKTNNNNMSLEEFVSQAEQLEKQKMTVSKQQQQGMDSSGVCPPVIPLSVAHACASLLNACCGPPSAKMERLTPAVKVRRSSDLALTAVFGFGLDLDLWNGLGGLGVLRASEFILRTVAERYGGPDVSYGVILRSQIPAQFLLDMIKLRFDNNNNNKTGNGTPQTQEETVLWEQIGHHLSQLLLAMLLASLSNRKVITQAEHDVASCMGALSDSPLGSIGCHVILEALAGILKWCDILPQQDPQSETTMTMTTPMRSQSLLDAQEGMTVEQERKRQVATRLGRNLLIGQFHDVVAPMLLSRTIFCGERSLLKDDKETAATNAAQDDDVSCLSWKHHWRLTLLIFAWATSISGAEGEIAAKSTGSLLLASGLAGSLDGCLVSNGGNDSRLVPSLILPPPVMSLTIASSSRGGRGNKSSWSYTDLLSERLRVMVPLLPGLVVSLVHHPEDAEAAAELEPISAASLAVLIELLAAVSGAFRRVYGVLSHNAMTQVRRIRTIRGGRSRSVGYTTAVKAAKDYVPPLLVVAMLLENHIRIRSSAAATENEIVVLPSAVKPATTDSRQRSDSDMEWVDVSSALTESTIGETVATIAATENDCGTSELSSEVLLAKLVACQNTVLNTLSELIVNAMRHGGGEASTIVWRSVISTLKESVVYSKKAPPTQKFQSSDATTSDQNEMADAKPDVGTEAGKSSKSSTDIAPQALAQNMLCRLVALVLTKAATREEEPEMWSTDLCSAIARLCGLVEEKDLLHKPMGVLRRTSDMSESAESLTEAHGIAPYSRDQILLICALLDIMEFGREMTGWCQIVFPTPPLPDGTAVADADPFDQSGSSEFASSTLESFSSHAEEAYTPRDYEATDDYDDLFSLPMPLTPRTRSNSGGWNQSMSPNTPGASSKLLLPILQPSLRIILDSFGNVRSDVMIAIPQVALSQQEDGTPGTTQTNAMKMSLLSHMANELRHTLMAAIVGLSFPNARDVALNSLASLRRSTLYHRNAHDDDGVKVCSFLFVSITEEIRVRYEGERRRREKALFDAYEDEQGTSDDKGNTVTAEEAESSREVERLILGGDLIPSKSKVETSGNTADTTETVTFFGVPIEQDQPASSAAPPNSRNRQGGGSEDFIMFHENYSTGDGEGSKDSVATKMGWSHYKGLGSALEKCSELAEQKAPSGHEAQVEIMLSVLASYLDTWDESVARDAAESELVELFDDAVSLGSDGGKLKSGDVASHQVSADQEQSSAMPILGSETAADAMTNFIEFSSMEKLRLNEVSSTFLPARRYSCMSFSERFCWAQYMEFAKDGTELSMERLWERGMTDGNRDVRSRLISMPCNPQFKRFIPSYLDHGSSIGDDESESAIQAAESKGGDDGVRRNSSFVLPENDLDLLNSTRALVEACDLEIVDITKKEIVEEEQEALLLNTCESTLDENGIDVVSESAAFLGFPDSDVSDEQQTDSAGEKSAFLDFPAKEESEEQIDGDKGMADSATESTSFERSQQEARTVDSVDKAELRSFHHNIASSSFSHPPDNSSSTMSLVHTSAARMIEFHFDGCLHVKTEGSRKCTLLLSATHLILEYDPESDGFFDGEMMAVKEEAERQRMIEEAGGGQTESDAERTTESYQEDLERRQRETAALRPKSMRFNMSELSHVYLRRYRLRDSALEMFFIPSGGSSLGGFGLYAPATSLFLDFGPGYEGNVRRDDAANAIMRRSPPQTIKQWPDRSGPFLHEQLSRLAMGWVEGRITNFDYLLHLNMLAGRSYNDLCQYPVMPWVLSSYHSKEIPDLSDRSNFRDLTKPMGALNPDRLEDFIDRFETFADPTIPPFMYGSHYSTSAGVVLHFLVRMHPFAGLHRQLQGGHFDVADRLFSSVPRTWDMCTGSSAAEVKELTPEWYCNPAFLKNVNEFKLGTSQDGEVLGNVTLPPWADGSPEKFIEVMRDALESDICSEMLPDWIDLIFGRKQQGPEAIRAHNVFFYLTYYGSVDVASIEDEGLRTATELQIAHFGQCPMQLFTRPHVRRVQRWRDYRRLTFYQMLSAYTQGAGPSTSDFDTATKRPMRTKDGSQRLFGEPLFLPFFSAPISHWVHLAAPPPGPHADLIAVRIAGLDRCLAVDAKGVFHSFRWAWKPEDVPPGDTEDDGETRASQFHSGPIDRGCFVAQRELPRFRTVPRLPHVPNTSSGDASVSLPAVGISKTLFSGRSLLLVLSDGDGKGALAMQLVDPAKGTVRGEAIVPSVHSNRITCVAMDPIGTAAGHGGVGGELAILGSADGGASIWRFMSSHYLPLRPRVRMRGHGGAKVHAVALSSAIHICATVSENRCCIYSVGNGAMIRSFPPPTDTLDSAFLAGENVHTKTVFCDTPALCLSVQGFLVCACQTTIASDEYPSLNRSVITLHLFSLEGDSLGSKPLESWRGVPHKIYCTPDGTAIFVCAGRGISIHRLSAVTPLEFIDEWHITESEELDETAIPTAWDVDFGPSIMRPVIGAAACSSGTLRLHALPGITHWSERHRKSGMTAAVGNALAKPAQRIKTAMGKGMGLGSKVVGMGREIGREVSSDVREKGVGGFLGNVIFRKNSKG